MNTPHGPQPSCSGTSQTTSKEHFKNSVGLISTLTSTQGALGSVTDATVLKGSSSGPSLCSLNVQSGENLPECVQRSPDTAWRVAAPGKHVCSSPTPPPRPSFSSPRIGKIQKHRLCLWYSEPITGFLWVPVCLSGPSGFLINYDLKGFDVPGIKRHEGGRAILRNINYLMNIIRRKLGLLNINLRLRALWLF